MMWSQRLLRVCVVVCVMVVSACSGGEERMWFEGSLPLEERETVEHFQHSVEPALGQFVKRMEAYSAGATLIRDSTLWTWGDAFDLSTASIGFDDPVDIEAARALGDELFIPLGFDTISVHGEGDDASIWWLNLKHGGYVRLMLLGPRGASISATSSRRPSDGSTVPNSRTRLTAPAWELALPKGEHYIPSRRDRSLE